MSAGAWCREGVRRRAVAGLLTALALALPACDRDITEGDLAVDNRSEVELTIVALPIPESRASDRTVGVVRSGIRQTIAGVDGCSPAGFEARTLDGEVVASLPPRERGSDDCRFTWVIEEDGSHIER